MIVVCGGKVICRRGYYDVSLLKVRGRSAIVEEMVLFLCSIFSVIARIRSIIL